MIESRKMMQWFATSMLACRIKKKKEKRVMSSVLWMLLKVGQSAKEEGRERDGPRRG